MTDLTPSLKVDMSVELGAWISDYAAFRGKSVGEVTAELLHALQDNRLYVRPRPGPNPYTHEPLFPEPPTNE